MLTKPFFLDPRENANAAAVVPLRGGPKATGNSKPFLTAFFSQAQHSSLTLRSSPLWLGHGAILFSQSLCNMAFQSQEDVESWPSEPPGALEGEGSHSPSVLGTGGLLGLAGVPWLTPENPRSGASLGVLVGLTLNTKHWALLFLPGAQSTSGRGCCLSQCNPNLSVDVCNISCFGLEKKWKTTFGFSVTFMRGSRKALSVPNLDHLKRKGHSWAIWSTWQPSCY